MVMSLRLSISLTIIVLPISPELDCMIITFYSDLELSIEGPCGSFPIWDHAVILQSELLFSVGVIYCFVFVL